MTEPNEKKRKLDLEGNNATDGRSNQTETKYVGSVPVLFDGVYFEIENIPGNPTAEGKVTVICKNCVARTVLRGEMSSTGNFLKHIECKHKDLKEAVKKKIADARASVNRENSRTYRTLKQPKLKDFGVECVESGSPSRGKGITQHQANMAVLNYVVQEMRPLRTVEKPSFVHLVKQLSRSNPTEIKCISGRALSSQLKEKKDLMCRKMISEFEKVDHVCTTADIWSANKKSFMGITAHYIDSATLERNSFALACRRMKFRHTNDEIAKVLHQVHSEYKIVDKVSWTVTDNASNFVKAFKVFSSNNSGSLEEGNAGNYDSEEPESDEEDDFTIEISEITLKTTAEMFDDDDTLGNVEDIFPAFEEIVLPNQLRCASHTLNLVATTDADKIKDQTYTKPCSVSIGRAKALWRLLSKSTNASDNCEEVCRTKFSIPNDTRWNSEYDAIKKLIVKEEEVNVLMEKLNLSKFRPAEFKFLREFVSVAQPLANALDILQGEQECFLGHVLPVLMSLKKRVLGFSSLTYCTPLQTQILQSIDRRFQNILDLNSGVGKFHAMASITLPEYKLRWMQHDDVEHWRSIFISECEAEEMHQLTSSNSSPDSNRLAERTPSSASADFCSVLENSLETPCVSPTPGMATIQAVQYLQDPKKDLKTLHEYPIVKKLFLKYNTPLPSSAPVERMFSTGKQIATPNRNRTNDKMFELLLLLKKMEFPNK